MAIVIGLANENEVTAIKGAGYDLAAREDVLDMLGTQGCVAVWVDCDLIDLLDQQEIREARRMLQELAQKLPPLCPYCDQETGEPEFYYDDDGYNVAAHRCDRCGGQVEIKNIPGCEQQGYDEEVDHGD